MRTCSQLWIFEPRSPIIFPDDVMAEDCEAFRQNTENV